MIGQKRLQSQIGEILQSGKFPRFSIFIGEEGSGRKTIINQMLSELGDIQECEISAEEIRNVIEQAYTTITPTVFLIPNADTMSVSAENALLKVTEEPPNNAYFVMTLINADNTLPTIRSRATLFYMDSYTSDEILDYYHRSISGEDDEIISRYCLVPQDVDKVCAYNIQEFQSFVQLTIDNIEKVSGANSFKIGSRINLGSDDKKYDLSLFWKAFRSECLKRMPTDPLKYVKGINITSKYLGERRIVGLNAQMAFDNWLLDIRKAWM